MRLASHEQELAALVGERESGSRVEELARRLDALERAPLVIAGAVDGSPVAGDGRFRVELRALELRAEVAEAMARESREAVLVQLERLAARVDWRFQRLEAESTRTLPKRPAEAGSCPSARSCRGVVPGRTGYTIPMRLLDLLFLLGAAARGRGAGSRTSCSRAWSSETARAAERARCLRDQVGHEDRVDQLVVAREVRLANPLSLEAERLVEP